MIKCYIVDSTYNNMRLDRWLRNKIGNLPQSLIEKYLRAGKIKINKKKVKSSFKIKANDKIDIFDLNFRESIIQKKKKYIPPNEIIKSNEDLILETKSSFSQGNVSTSIMSSSKLVI